MFLVMRSHSTARRGRRAWPWLAALLVLTLAMLAACAGQPASPRGGASATRASSTATSSGSAAGPSATPSASAATTPAPQATATTPPDWSFSATVNEQFSAAYCTGSQPSGSICLSGTGTGQGSPVGQFTFTRTAVMQPGGSDSCGPSTVEGSFITASSDTVSFTAKGTFCRATQAATYTYTITGGSGKYANATGTGKITVPAPTTSTTDTQTWIGTLVYAQS